MPRSLFGAGSHDACAYQDHRTTTTRMQANLPATGNAVRRARSGSISATPAAQTAAGSPQARAKLRWWKR